MKIFLYSHGGSGNHGCEAIVRGTASIFKQIPLKLYSNNKKQDEKYGIDQVIELEDSRKSVSRYNPKRVTASLLIRIFHKDNYATKLSIEHMLKNYGEGDIGLSIGGDNYCYPGFEEFGKINQMIRQTGVKTVLWGCSVEPTMINDTMKEDLLGYELIVARESITWQALNDIGAKTVLFPDPAFYLTPKKREIPFKEDDKIVGINISPHIMRCENKKGMAYENYCELIRYILNETDYKIMLIPHVVWNENDDRLVNQKLYEEFEQNGRIALVDDCSCEELKYLISKCTLFVGARTHATIAAYSTGVPTLVVGYSVKAKGIAKDLFGTEEHYVLPVQNLQQPSELLEAFRWIDTNKTDIRNYLKIKLASYISDPDILKKKILGL